MLKCILPFGEIFPVTTLQKKQTKKLALLDYCLFALSMPEKAMTDAFSLVPSPDGVGWWRVKF